MENASKYESVIDSRDSKFFRFGELWEYRELFYFFTWRDIKVKYKQTVLGFLWVVLQPVFMVLIFTFFFNRALHLPSENLPYSVFAFSGLVLWNFFSAGIINAGNSMVSNSNIIKKVYFPRLIIPFSGIISSAFDMFVSLGVFIFTLIMFQVPVNIWQVLFFWPLAFVIAFLSAIGLGCLLSSLMVKYRDFRYIIPFMMQALLFLTPIIYPVSMLHHDWVKYILALNPMYAAIVSFRYPMVNVPIESTLYSISVLSGTILLVVGIAYFKKTERYFADLA